MVLACVQGLVKGTNVERAYGFEHFQTCDSNSLGSSVDAAIFRALVAPFGTGASIQQHTDQEQVNQTAAFFAVVNTVPG